MRPRDRGFIVSLLLLVLTIAGGCGTSDEKDKDKKAKAAASQVAAKVNSTEITVSQVNAILARTPSVPADAADRAKREILERLIDQELAKQQAIEKKLDRRPEILRALENAKNEILARAYLEQVAADQPKPTLEMAKKYFADHPELFSQRRIFDIEEILIAPQDGLAAALKEQMKKSRSMQEIANWLKSREVKYTANRGVRAAEQIPLDRLPKLNAMKDGEIQLFEMPAGELQVVRLAETKAAPVNEAVATPRIQQFLYNRDSNVLVTKDLKGLREKAKIEYVGEFVVTPEQSQAKAKAAAEAKEKEIAAAKAKAELEAQVKAAAQAQADAETQARAERLAKARAEAEKARLEAEAKAKDRSGSKAEQLPPGTIDKGLRGIR